MTGGQSKDLGSNIEECNLLYVLVLMNDLRLVSITVESIPMNLPSCRHYFI